MLRYDRTVYDLLYHVHRYTGYHVAAYGLHRL